MDSRKSSKSVTFVSTEITDVHDQETSPDPSGRDINGDINAQKYYCM